MIVAILLSVLVVVLALEAIVIALRVLYAIGDWMLAGSRVHRRHGAYRDEEERG